MLQVVSTGAYYPLVVTTGTYYAPNSKIRVQESQKLIFLLFASILDSGWQGHHCPRVIDRPVPGKLCSWRPELPLLTCTEEIWKCCVGEILVPTPRIGQISWEIWMQFFNENEIQFCSEANPCHHFPQIGQVGELPCDFEVVFRHFVMKMSEHKLLQNGLHVRARANQSFSVRFSEYSVRGGPSKILHPLQRGCHSRLSICKLKEISANTVTEMLSRAIWQVYRSTLHMSCTNG